MSYEGDLGSFITLGGSQIYILYLLILLRRASSS
jgi:hypothetical protein